MKSETGHWKKFENKINAPIPNMFFDGMEEKTVELSEKAFQAGRDFFENCVQLTSRHLIKKLQEEMMIKFR